MPLGERWRAAGLGPRGRASPQHVQSRRRRMHLARRHCR